MDKNKPYSVTLSLSVGNQIFERTIEIDDIYPSKIKRKIRDTAEEMLNNIEDEDNKK